MVILTAVDGDRQPDPPVALGQDLAESYGDPLVVLHVVPQRLFAERHERETAVEGHSEYAVDDAAADAAGVADEVVAATLEDDSGVETVGRVGDPVAEILAEGRERDARYLVLGGRRRSPTGKALFGSTLQSVLLDADRPVVTHVADGDS